MVTSVFSIPPQPDLPGVDVLGTGSSRELPYFLAGTENQLLLEAAATVTDDWARFTPLFISGPSGFGKTHLSHCLVATARQQYPGLSHLHFTGSDYARAINHAFDVNATKELRLKHQSVDLLVVDGIHELAEYPAAQSELQLTLDQLTDRGAVVVLTSRSEIERLPRLRVALLSRLLAGLVVRLAKPRGETVHALLNALQLATSAEPISQLRNRTNLSSDHAAATVSELRSTLLRHEYQFEAQAPANLSEITAKQILRSVAKYFHVTQADLLGTSRRKTIATARSMAAYLLRSRLDISFKNVGQCLGGRDHTTVLHAFRRAQSLVASDSRFHLALTEIIADLR